MIRGNAGVGGPFTVHGVKGGNTGNQNLLLIADGKKKLTQKNKDHNNNSSSSSNSSCCRRMSDGAAADLQVPLQPLVLPEEQLLAKLQVEVDLGGEGDDVGRPDVPAGRERVLLLNNDNTDDVRNPDPQLELRMDGFCSCG